MEQFVSFIERDNNGKIAAYVTLNTNYIITASYVPAQGTLIMVTEDPLSTTRKFKQPLVNKKGEQTGATFESVGTQTENRTVTITEEENIVTILNKINGTYHTVKDYPGFKVREELKKEFEAAMAKKQADEDAKNASPIIDPNTNEPVNKEEGTKLIIT